MKIWVYCYPTHTGLNSNMHIKRMHRTIKYIYLKARKVKRLDKCLTHLLKFLCNEIFKRLIMQHKDVVSIKLKDLRNCHKNQQFTKIWLPGTLQINNGLFPLNQMLSLRCPMARSMQI